MAEQPRYYALDRIEGGLAVLQAVPMAGDAPEQAQSCTVPAAALCTDLPEGKTRPADGTLFWQDTAGVWRPDYEATRRRQHALRERVRRLTGRGAG